MPVIKVEPATDNPMKPKDIEYEINENGCWNVTSHHWQSDGYPRISRAGKIVKMSRYIWTEFIGPIPPGMLVLHSPCDNCRCINPDHLYLGTYKDNACDVIERNRFHPNPLLGSKHQNSKLTEKQVGKILKSDEDCKILAKKYGVCFQNISMIRNGKTWLHVPGPRGERKRGPKPNFFPH